MSISNFLIHSYHKNTLFNSLETGSNFTRGGILIDDNLYGKCVLPSSQIKIEGKEMTLIQFFYQYCNSNLPELKKGQEKWIPVPGLVCITTYDTHNHILKS